MGCDTLLEEAKIKNVEKRLMPTAYLEEVNPWEAQVARSDLAAQKLKLDDGLWKILREPSREIIVHIPVQLDNGRLETFSTRLIEAPQRAASATVPT
jgi:hypothetical protein